MWILLPIASLALASPAQDDAANPCPSPPAYAKVWSDPATWPEGRVPRDGELATIDAGTTVYLDTSTASLGGLAIQGELIVLCGDHTITADWIQVKGLLEIGTYGHRFHHDARIKLTRDHDVPSPIVMLMPPPATVMVPPVLAVEGAGTLRLIGDHVGATWTRLEQTAAAGARVIELQHVSGWRPGQRVVIASTDFDTNQAEMRVVERVEGKRVTLAEPLAHTHWGATEGRTFDGFGIEERAEVGLLDRKIVIEGVQDGGATAGHTVFMNRDGAGAPRGELDSVELFRLGNSGMLGQYPVHFHHVGDVAGSFVRNSSIHETYNRAITLHGSQNIEVTGNVAYENQGHAYYFEDNSVVGCTMRGNLGISTRVGHTLASDARPATFWVHNPRNRIDANTAAGSDGDGFWFETEHWDTQPWTSFSSNVAHSNLESGFMQDERRPKPDPPSIYHDLTSYKNRRFGIWLRTYGESIVTHSRFADNRCGIYFASEGFQFDLYAHVHGNEGSRNGISKAWLRDSLVIGETANVGEPTRAVERLAGRSLPQLHRSGDPLQPPWDALTGIEIYDGFVGVENCVFAEFREKTLAHEDVTFDRKAGALHQVFYYNPWAVDPRNHIRGLRFVADETTVTRPVYYRTPQGQNAPSWCESGYRLDDGGIANLTLQDLDGSLGLPAGSTVMPRNPFLMPADGARVDEDWNAIVTEGPPIAPYAQLDFAQLWRTKEMSTETWDGKPVLVQATFHSIARDVRFTKAGPVVDLCNPDTERVLPRIVTNVLSDEAYAVEYDPALSPEEWPEQIAVSLQFTEPGRWVHLLIPLAREPEAAKVRVDGEPAPRASDAIALAEGPGGEWWYDAEERRLHLKIVTGGTGDTVHDGERSTFVVNR